MGALRSPDAAARAGAEAKADANDQLKRKRKQRTRERQNEKERLMKEMNSLEAQIKCADHAPLLQLELEEKQEGLEAQFDALFRAWVGLVTSEEDFYIYITTDIRGSGRSCTMRWILDLYRRHDSCIGDMTHV
jgi:hypothetical protein